MPTIAEGRKLSFDIVQDGRSGESASDTLSIVFDP